MDFYIQKDKAGNAHVASVETNMPVTVDMDLKEAWKFLKRMQEIKSKSLKPNEPRLFYNRASE